MNARLLEVVDPENLPELDLDHRMVELSVPLLVALSELKGSCGHLCFFGSIQAARQLGKLIADSAPDSRMQLWRFPAAWRDRSALARLLVCHGVQEVNIACERHLLSTDDQKVLLPSSANSNYVAYLVRALFSALAAGDVFGAIERATAVAEAHSLAGDLSVELRAHATGLLHLLQDERTVFFPASDETQDRGAISQAFSFARLANQLCDEGLFRFIHAGGHVGRVSGLPYGQARANVLGVLSTLKSAYVEDLLVDQLGDVAVKVLMMQIEFLRARARYEIASGEVTVAFAFLYRAFELFLLMVLTADRVVTISNHVLNYGGVARLNGTGALLNLARPSLRQFLTREKREQLEAAVEMRNKSLLGHEMLSIPVIFFEDIARAINLAIIEFSKYKGLAGHRKALREAAFGPESLKHYAALFRKKFLAGREIEIPYALPIAG